MSSVKDFPLAPEMKEGCVDKERVLKYPFNHDKHLSSMAYNINRKGKLGVTIWPTVLICPDRKKHHDFNHNPKGGSNP